MADKFREEMTMGRKGRPETHGWVRRNTYLLLGVGVWSVVIGAFLVVNLTLDEQAIVDRGLVESRLAYEALTLVGPDLMVRGGHFLGRSGDGPRGHITSLNPISPKNQPDDWEKKALRRLVAGAAETSEIMDIDGRSYLRLMRPLTIERNCLRCHAGQGYKVGDVRGGISVDVPMTVLWDIARPNFRAEVAGFGVVWLIGLGAVALAILAIQRRTRERAEHEAEFHEMFDDAPVAYHEIARDGAIRRVNRAECVLLGFEAGEMLGRPVWDFVAETDREASREAVRRKVAGVDPLVPLQRRYVRRDGGELLLEIHEKLVRNAAGETTGLRSALLNITDRKRAEDALALQAKIAVIFASTPDGEMFDEVLRIVLDAMQSPFGLFGYIDEDGAKLVPTMTRQVWSECAVANKTIHIPSNSGGDSSRPRAIREKRANYSNEVSNRVPEGHVGIRRHISLPILFQEEVIGLFQVANKETDYTEKDVRTLQTIAEQVAPILQARLLRDRAGQERERLRAQLQQAQKMESIGHLAGGVAHDFNNLLTVINGYSELLLTKLSTGDPLQANLSEIHKAGERAAKLTEQLLAFSRKQVLEPRKLDLNRVVEGIRPMLERLVGEAVEVRVALNAEAGTVHADPHQLEQVIMNLTVNARDAMPGGGWLLIETASAERDESYARSHPEARAGRYVMLAVSDSGVGMDEETRQQIFEPFFTTKGVGKGTGLGLSMVQGIVAQSGGHINVYTEPGHGTTFKIYLPKVADAAPGVVMPEAVPTLEGKETVLVVEDLAEVRQFAATVLEAYGYRALKAESAGEALMLCEQQRIDLVVTDVVMPNLSGWELANRLEKLRPGIKVLFMSGYTDKVIVHNGILDESAKFIQKPFSPKQLAVKVREVLGTPRPAPVTAP